MQTNRTIEDISKSHSANQEHKLLVERQEMLELENKFLHGLLGEIKNRLKDEVTTTAMTETMKGYDETWQFKNRLFVYEQLNISELLKEQCQLYNSECSKAGLEVFFDDLPKFSGDLVATRALFANLFRFVLYDLPSANSISIKFETSKHGNSLKWVIDRHAENTTNLSHSDWHHKAFILLAKQLAPALNVDIDIEASPSQILLDLRLR